MQSLGNNLAAFEELVMELVLAVEFSAQSDIKLIDALARIDLSEFELTPQEKIKFKSILKKLNFHLTDALSQNCPAVSVVTDIQPKNTSLTATR